MRDYLTDTENGDFLEEKLTHLSQSGWTIQSVTPFQADSRGDPITLYFILAFQEIESKPKTEKRQMGWICEVHPELEWPHGDCAGPGQADYTQVEALVYQRDQARAERDKVAEKLERVERAMVVAKGRPPLTAMGAIEELKRTCRHKYQQDIFAHGGDLAARCDNCGDVIQISRAKD